MLSLGLVKWLKASAQEAPQVTKDGAMQKQDTGEQPEALTRARESEIVVDRSRTGGLGHTEVASLGNLGERARRRAGGPDEEVEIMSQYKFDRKRREKENEDFMSLIEMSVSASKRTTVENRRRRRTSVAVVSEGTAMVGRGL